MSLGSQINHFLRSPDTREQSLAGDFHFFLLSWQKLYTTIYIYSISTLAYTFIHNIVCNTNFWYRRHSPWHDLGIIRVNFSRTCGTSVSSSFFLDVNTFFQGLPAEVFTTSCTSTKRFMQTFLKAFRTSRSHHGAPCRGDGSWSSYEQVEFFRGPCKK